MHHAGCPVRYPQQRRATCVPLEAHEALRARLAEAEKLLREQANSHAWNALTSGWPNPECICGYLWPCEEEQRIRTFLAEGGDV